MKMNKRLNTYYIALILNSYARLVPENAAYLADLGPELHDRLVAAVNTETFRVQPGQQPMQHLVEQLIPDITSYCNLWLAITCFGVKSNINAISEPSDLNEEEKHFALEEGDQAPEVRARGMVRVLARDLIKLFNGNKRWKNTELDIGEAANIAVAIASLKLEGQGPIERFIADIGDIIRANVKNASSNDLINLAKSTFYLRKFAHTKDLYTHVHAECLTRFNLKQLDADEKEVLTKVFAQHGVFGDSPFAGTSRGRVSR